MGTIESLGLDHLAVVSRGGEIDDDELAAISVVARRVARALRDVLAAPGMWLHHVSGEAAGQDVFHYHLHLIPRYDDDAVQPGWGAPPWRPPDMRAADLDGIAARVREALAKLAEIR